MNWKLVFALVLVIIVLIDAKGPKKPKGPQGKKGNKLKEKLEKPRDTCVRGICTKNNGKSGKFTINKKGKDDKDQMTVLFDAIHEMDANGTAKVGKKGKPTTKHSLDSFAPLDFEFTALSTIEMFKPEINGSGVSASFFTFSTVITGTGANLEVNMYFINGSGNGSICENQTFSVYPGMVKFDITIDNWTFCTAGDCDGEVGEFVDFVMTFQKKGKAKKGKKNKKTPKGKKALEKLFIGDQDIGFPNMYEVDDMKCAEMPEGYPMIKAKGGDKYSVTFRFPKFASKVFYDPTVGDARDEGLYTDASGVDQPEDPSATPTPSGAGYQLPSLLATFVFAAFARFYF